MKTMAKFGVKCVGWLAGAVLSVSLVLTACGSDSASQPTANAGEAGASDAGASALYGGEAGNSNGEGGAAPVATGDLACVTNADCKGELAVCDPVLGCVACIYDWDCPAAHRCDDHQCFKKQECSENAPCEKDSAHPLCDPIQKVCVGCRLDGDCKDGQRCGASRCEATEACTNSKNCTVGKVCDRVLGVCVACVGDGDCGAGSACVANSCVPECNSDKVCLGIGLLCDPKLGRCVECTSQADCPGDYFCSAAGVCMADVCQAGQGRCENLTTHGTCSVAGDKFDNATCQGGTSCQEQGEMADCETWVCTPSAVTCAQDKGSVVTCSEDGLSVEKTEPCGAGQACVNAACKDVVCPPSGAVCDGSDLYSCDATGTVKTKVKTCLTNFTCDTATVSCLPPACSANSPVCDENKATTCAADGSGPLPGGTACADGKACYQGSCQSIVCSGAYQCVDGTLLKCGNNGTAGTIQSLCGAPGLCDAVAAKCLTPKCTPNAFACNGAVAAHCKADGSDYEAGGTDCAAQSLVCDSGGCLPKVCKPSTYFCQDGSPWQCSASGATYVPSDTCQANEYCLDGASQCLFDKCTAGSSVCNSNVATTCAADGSGPVAGGVDCALTGKQCVAGACKDIVCTKGSLACQGEALYQCNDSGTGTTLYQNCQLSQFCDSSGETAACVPDVCSAGGLGCNQEVVSTCASNGGSWTNPGTNCSTSNQLCGYGGTCAAQEVTVQGTPTYSNFFSTGGSLLASFRVTTPRKLTLLEAYASVPGLQKFTWVVYLKRSNSNTFDLVYQKVTAQSSPALGWVGSGAISYTFATGKTYAIGVHIAGASSSYSGLAPAALAKAGFITTPGSFLFSEGAKPATFITPGATSYAPYVRFSTALP